MTTTATLIKNALTIAFAAMPSFGTTGTLPVTIADAVANAAPVAIETNVAADTAADAPIVDVREEAVRTYRVPMTAYSSTPDQTDDTPFTTADGSHVRDGIIAANFLPMGTRVRLPELYGDKVFEVHDRMNRRYPFRADIWMETRREAVVFGLKRSVLMEVLPKAEKELAVK